MIFGINIVGVTESRFKNRTLYRITLDLKVTEVSAKHKALGNISQLKQTNSNSICALLLCVQCEGKWV